MIEISRVVNGFLIYPNDDGEPLIVEGTNPRTVAAKLGRVVIKVFNDREVEKAKEVAPNVDE